MHLNSGDHLNHIFGTTFLIFFFSAFDEVFLQSLTYFHGTTAEARTRYNRYNQNPISIRSIYC